MKSLNEFKTPIQEEVSDYSKFDVLVRAGLANKAQMQRIHTILDKMKEDKPTFNNADRMIIQNLFNKMVDLISSNKQINQLSRRAVKEDMDEAVLPTSDFKLSKDGRKVKAHRLKVGDVGYEKDEDDLKEASLDIPHDPPAVLVLKRQAIRMYPNGARIALYYSKTLDKHFSVAYGAGVDAPVQAESTDMCKVCGQTPCNCTSIQEAVMDTLHRIVKNKQHEPVKFADGTNAKVDHYTASAITQVHNALNDVNKKKFADMVHKSKAHFTRASDFAFRHMK